MDSGDRDVIWEGLALVFRLRLYAWIPAWVWIIPIILIIYFLMSKKYLFSIYVKRMICVRVFDFKMQRKKRRRNNMMNGKLTTPKKMILR